MHCMLQEQSPDHNLDLGPALDLTAGRCCGCRRRRRKQPIPSPTSIGNVAHDDDDNRVLPVQCPVCLLWWHPQCSITFAEAHEADLNSLLQDVPNKWRDGIRNLCPNPNQCEPSWWDLLLADPVPSSPGQSLHVSRRPAAGATRPDGVTGGTGGPCFLNPFNPFPSYWTGQSL